MSDRRAARQRVTTGLAAVFGLVGAIAVAQPLLPSNKDITLPTITNSPSSGWKSPPVEVVPPVVGRTQYEAQNILTNAGFGVEVREGKALPPGDTDIGKVERQELKPTNGSPPILRTVIIYVATEGGCDDGFPWSPPDTLFIRTFDDREICFVKKTAPGEPTFAYAESLPRPCEPTNLPSDALIEGRRGFSNQYNEGIDAEPATTSFDQVITKYRNDGAAAYLDEIRDAIQSCDPVTRDHVRVTYTVVSAKPLGDERLMLRVEYKMSKKEEATPQTSTYTVSIVRVGSYVSVIYDQGWEGYPSKPETIEKLAGEVAEKLSKIT